jgi:kynureninase
MSRLREKSIALTGYLESLIRKQLSDVLDIATPSKLEQRGCQLSLRVRGPRDAGRSLYEHLLENGVIVDWREPDVIRAAPTPLYNRFQDCIAFVDAVLKWQSVRN